METVSEYSRWESVVDCSNGIGRASGGGVDAVHSCQQVVPEGQGGGGGLGQKRPPGRTTIACCPAWGAEYGMSSHLKLQTSSPAGSPGRGPFHAMAAQSAIAKQCSAHADALGALR